jgi:hypothetical protein
MATSKNRSIARPAKDEWGVYDPQQAGLAALFARLDRDHKIAAPSAAAAPALRSDVADPTRPAIPAPPITRDVK